MSKRVPLLNSKLVRLILLLARTSPGLTFTSIAAKAAFLLMQLASILLIFSWINQSIPQLLIVVTGLESSSNWFAFMGAAGLVLSSAMSLLSKKMALKGIVKVERIILDRVSDANIGLQKGDLKNIVKVLLSVTDVIVPIMLMGAVIVSWIVVTPYSAIAIVILAVFALPLMKRGVSFSAKRYQPGKARIALQEYLDSEEHLSFYKIMIMPNYIGLAMFTLISVGIILSVMAARVYFDGQETFAHILIIATAVAFLQARSFVGIILRTGAYNRSITKVHDIIRPSTDS